MSHSEDEDDFLSADETVEFEEDTCDTNKSTKRGNVSKNDEPTESRKTKVIRDGKASIGVELPIAGKKSGSEQESVEDKTGSVGEPGQHKDSCPQKPSRKNKEEGAAINNKHSRVGGKRKQEEEEDNNDDEEEEEGDGDEDEDEDDEEEAALAERIRERNLKIARTFAKNLQASAPIPVKPSTSSARRDRESSDNNLGATDLNGSFNPPAPPPTPALSSSYNNQSELTNQNTSGASPSLSTQYAWRLPPKPAGNNLSTTDVAASSTPAVASSNLSRTESELAPSRDGDSGATASSSRSSEQARLALDRLSEKLSKPEKNLFEKVADDIRNMSIKGEDLSIASDVTSQLSALPTTISDLSSTIGGWGWSGATKLLSSATQVTTQVGSVLNTLADVSQQRLVPPPVSVAPVRQDEHPGSSTSKRDTKND